MNLHIKDMTKIEWNTLECTISLSLMTDIIEKMSMNIQSNFALIFFQ